MRKTGVLILMLLGVVALAAPARATVIAADSFTYAAGTVVGKAGGTGWTGAWGGNNSVQVVTTPSTPLSYGGINGGNKALAVYGTNSNVAFRTFPTQNDTIYMRYLFRYTRTLPQAGNEFAALWIDNNPPVVPDHSFKRVNMGLKMDRGPAPGNEDLMGRLNNGAADEIYGPNLVVGETYLLVGKLYKSTPGSLNPYDRFQFWVNPGAGSEGTPLGTSSISGTVTNSFFWLGIRTANLPTALEVWMDEMMLATSWNDVVPEPSSAILSALVLGAGYLVRRRVRK